jgi:hypothetical protein
MIQCNEITQTVNELLISFADCNKYKNEDLRKLVELVAAVNTCANGGVDYGLETTLYYEPLTDQVINFPINSFHSYSLMVLEGNITQQVDFSIITYPTRATLNTEFTNLNQTPIEFTVLAGSKIVFKYLTETI